MKASEIIRQSCCGQLLDVSVRELTKKVETLEDEIVFLNHRLENANTEIQRIKRRR